jgi:hypothetical protein
MLLLLVVLLLIGVAAGRHVVRGSSSDPDELPVPASDGDDRPFDVPALDAVSMHEVALAAEQPEPDLTGWSDDVLSLAWRSSYLRLQRLQEAHHWAGIDAVARERGHYLDEIERRHPAGFSAWIASGARAPSDPTRYLGSGERTGRDGQDA